MDPVTHLLGGALAGRTLAPAEPPQGRRALAVGALAGLFPDIDFLARFVLDPLDALNFHRGVTHSLLLMPLWALLVGGLLARLFRLPVRRVLLITAAGITLHILLDLITPYGTRILSPWSDQAYTLGTTFVIDPLITLLLALGLWLALGRRRRWIGAATFSLVVLVIGGQALQRQRAEALAAQWAHSRGLAPEQVLALPQPFSPWNWKLVVTTRDRYWITHLHLGEKDSLLKRLYPRHWPLGGAIHGYRPASRARWHEVSRFGPQPSRAQKAWQSPAAAPLRRFARLPAWYDRDAETGCLWFTDQRFTLPTLRPFFLFAICPQRAGWSVARGIPGPRPLAQTSARPSSRHGLVGGRMG